MSGGVDLYRPAPGLALAVGGAAAARRHFRAEYGAVRVADALPDVVVDVGTAARLPPAPGRGRHKTVSWQVEVAPPDARPVWTRLLLAGRPRRFGLSLVQGFVVEPLVSLAAAEQGLVLLPAAALARPGEEVLLIGRSRSGKTSVVARALAAGHRALGDDQVLLDAAGGLRPWPRRLRVYPDLRETAPAAVAALPGRRRLALHALAALATVSRGWVAPSLPLAWQDLGHAPAPGPVPARRVVVVERGGSGADLEIACLQTSAVVQIAAAVLSEQRARLLPLLPAGWQERVRRAEEQERRTLATALADVPAEHWLVPASWPAPRAVSALAARLGVDPPVA